MNKLTLIGQLDKLPTYHCTEKGRDLIRFELTTGGEKLAESSDVGTVYYPQTTDHHCVAWGPAALDLKQHLKVGDRLMIQGELHYRTHRNRRGELKRFAEVYVRGFSYLGDGEISEKPDQPGKRKNKRLNLHFAYRSTGR